MKAYKELGKQKEEDQYGLIGKRLEEDKKRKSLIVAASALAIEEDQRVNADKKINTETTMLKSASTVVEVKTNSRRLSVKSGTKTTDKGLGL